jgi:hypothetical protein
MATMRSKSFPLELGDPEQRHVIPGGRDMLAILKRLSLLSTILLVVLQLGSLRSDAAPARCQIDPGPADEFDNSQRIEQALATGCEVDGGGRSYLIRQGVDVPSHGKLMNITLLQVPFESDQIRSVRVQGGPSGRNQGAVLERVRVVRLAYDGDRTRVGELGRSAGIWVTNADDLLLTDVEVTGDGNGCGISVIDASRLRIVRPYVHDLHWYRDAPPRYEQVMGIWLIRVDDADVLDARIEDLGGKVGDQPADNTQADGIDLSATTRVSIRGAKIRRVWEGIDVTGSEGNAGFEIATSAVYDAYAFGFKFANSAINGYVHENLAVDCGFAGFVVSGPGEEGLTKKTQDIVLMQNRAVRSGSNRNWTHTSVAGTGFLVLRTQLDPTYPRGIFIYDATSDGNPAYTRYGFYNEVTAGDPQNAVRRTDSIGHSIEGNVGFPLGDLEDQVYSPDSLVGFHQRILSCLPTERHLQRWWDRYSKGVWTASRIKADIIDLQRRGIYSSCKPDGPFE